jgi:hypothetical protein
VAAFALLVSLLGTAGGDQPVPQGSASVQQIRDDGPTSHHTKLGHAHDGRRRDHPGHAAGYFLASLIT